MICSICKEEFTPPEGYDAGICGTCGQILMDEDIAYEAREAHEESEHEAEDRGTYELHGGYR